MYYSSICLFNQFFFKFFQRLAFPVREDFFPHKTALVVRYAIRVLRARDKVVHLAVDPLPRKFRCQDTALAVFADGPDDEFPLKNMHPQPGAAVIKRLCAADAGGLSLTLFVGFRPVRSTLAGNLQLCIYIILSYLFNSCGKHISFPPFGQCRLRIHYHADLRCVNGLRNLAQNTKESYEFCT